MKTKGLTVGDRVRHPRFLSVGVITKEIGGSQDLVGVEFVHPKTLDGREVFTWGEYPRGEFERVDAERIKD
jgi:hypothetical protein